MTVFLDHLRSAVELPLPPRVGPGATLAVEMFFMISGFYMALILGEKYLGKDALRAFYKNRLLRLYPAYLFVVVVWFSIVVIFRLSHGQWTLYGPIVPMFAQATWLTKLHVIVANLTFVGQNALFFLKYCADGSLALHCTDTSAIPPSAMLLLPQAWSIEVEILFYLLCPLILRLRTRTLALLICVLLALKTYAVYATSPDNDYWIFRFPGFEFALFFLGIIAYRIYKNHLKNKKIGAFGYGIISVFAFFFIICQFIPWNEVKFSAAYILTFAALPFLFRLSKSNKKDRWIGDLSYPIYLVHWPVMRLIFYWYRTDHVILPATAATIIVSILVNYFVQRPIEKFRVFKRKPDSTAGPAA